jgi:hypothetical protein
MKTHQLLIIAGTLLLGLFLGSLAPVSLAQRKPDDIKTIPGARKTDDSKLPSASTRRTDITPLPRFVSRSDVGRFQSVRWNDTQMLVIDTATGQCWTVEQVTGSWRDFGTPPQSKDKEKAKEDGPGAKLGDLPLRPTRPGLTPPGSK